MKRALLPLACVLVGVGLGLLWTKMRGANASAPVPAAEKAADDEAGPTIETDASGHVVIKMSDEMQGDIGIKVAQVAPASFNPELKGYGRVLDPAPLAALMTELASDQAAYVASSNDVARLRVLAAQGNTSTRALQTAEAAALHDQLAIQSVKDRLALGWGRALVERGDFLALMQSLASLSNALVRIDLPADEKLDSALAGARIQTLSGASLDADFLGPVANVDPQTQGQGFTFLAKSGAHRLLPNEFVTGYVRLASDAVQGVIIPREAIIRTDGAAWVYVMAKSSEAFTRVSVSLDHATEGGWFVTNGVTGGDYVVVTGAQTLLSQEMQSLLKPD